MTPINIDTLDKLINLICNIYNNSKRLYDIKDVVKYYQHLDWSKYVDLRNIKESFYKKRIFRNNDLEIFIIVWQKGHTTPFHHHPSNGCVLYILDGELEEHIVSNLPNTEYFYRRKIFESSYMDDKKGVHSITAIKNSVSLHIYSPPGFYDKKIDN